MEQEKRFLSGGRYKKPENPSAKNNDEKGVGRLKRGEEEAGIEVQRKRGGNKTQH